MSAPVPTWNTNDIEFDPQGRLIIKNPQLVAAIREQMSGNQPLIILTLPLPQPHPHPDPPNDMCDCVAVPRTALPA